MIRYYRLVNPFPDMQMPYLRQELRGKYVINTFIFKKDKLGAGERRLLMMR